MDTQKQTTLNNLATLFLNNPFQTGVLVLSGTLIVALVTFAFLSQTLKPVTIVKDHPLEELAYNPFQTLTLEARAAYVFDIREDHELFALNEETQLPLASITKLMTALVASEILGSEGTVTIENTAVAQNGDSGLITSERFKVQDLIDFTLLASSNDGAYALAAAAGAIAQSNRGIDSYGFFIKRMNDKSRELALVQTYYTNATGLDNGENVSGGYGSARDTAFLFKYIILSTPTTVSATRLEMLELASSETIHTARNTNNVINSIPGLIASKTGYTDLAGGNLAVVFDVGINHLLVAVVLGSTQEGRFRDIQKLISASFDAIQN